MELKDNKFYIVEINFEEDIIYYYENEFKRRIDADEFARKFGSNFSGFKGSRIKEMIKRGKAHRGSVYKLE